MSGSNEIDPPCFTKATRCPSSMPSSSRMSFGNVSCPRRPTLAVVMANYYLTAISKFDGQLRGLGIGSVPFRHAVNDRQRKPKEVQPLFPQPSPTFLKRGGPAVRMNAVAAGTSTHLEVAVVVSGTVGIEGRPARRACALGVQVLLNGKHRLTLPAQDRWCMKPIRGPSSRLVVRRFFVARKAGIERPTAGKPNGDDVARPVVVCTAGLRSHLHAPEEHVETIVRGRRADGTVRA